MTTLLALLPTLFLSQFDPTLNGPWRTRDLGALDPKGMLVMDSAAWVWGKTPLDGPPLGGLLVPLEEGTAVSLAEEPAFFLAEQGGWLVGSKGVTGSKQGHLFMHLGGETKPFSPEAFDSELVGATRHQGTLYVATQADGVWRATETTRSRVGVKSTVLPSGFEWAQSSAFSGDVETIAASPDGVVVLGKDFQVRRVTADGDVVLGNVAEVQLDAGVVVSAMREPKGLMVTGTGEIYVGTKGREGSPEGRDVGAVFRWDGTAWQSLSAGVRMLKEVKSLTQLEGALVAGTSESGVWRLDGTTWSTLNEGLPIEAGKIKANELQRGASGALYVPFKNALYRRLVGEAAWSERGFFPNGEEIKAVAERLDGSIVVGCKVGTGQGAVYTATPAGWSQLGGDLPLEVKRLVRTPDDTLYAVLGGVGGAWRWSGTAWVSLADSLVGNASQVKELLVLADGSLVVGTKQGVWGGTYRNAPVTLLSSALADEELASVETVGQQVVAIAKRGGLFRLETGDGDDGLTWTRINPATQIIELEGAGVARAGGSIYLLGKRLLYRLKDDLSLEAVGDNPGKVARDGDGNLVFTGETAFTSIALDTDGRIYAGTKDGLFVAASAGAPWEFFNGPGEVKGLAIVGTRLLAAVKREAIVEGVTTKAASSWETDLAAAPAVAPPKTGCSVGLQVPVLLAALALAFRRRWRR